VTKISKNKWLKSTYCFEDVFKVKYLSSIKNPMAHVLRISIQILKHMNSVRTLILNGLLLCCMFASCTQAQTKKVKAMENDKTQNTTNNNHSDTATFGQGCFWCAEAIFSSLDGVKSVTSGYSGGKRENPSYEQVCSGATGHAEVVNIVFDPSKIKFDDLLQAFWSSHDPTTLNQQGADVGTQYRSVVFYHSPEQKALAEKYKKELDALGAFKSPIVTEISAFTAFYKAEDYHQQYFDKNGEAPYCQIVIRPKVEKFAKVFKDKLKHK
jgi:peptide-methionine (S)-S-oxide reductase